MTTKQPRQPNCLPVKSTLTGDTLALISAEGLKLRNRRNKQWETFSIETLLELQNDAMELQDEHAEQAK